MERAGRLIGKLRVSATALTAEERARAAWPAAVGKKIAGHTNAVALVRGRLVVEVEDAIWQRQLTTLRGQIIARLQEMAGPETVQDVSFRPAVPRRTAQRAETSRPEPFHLLPDDADSIVDPVLRRVYITSRKKASA